MVEGVKDVGENEKRFKSINLRDERKKWKDMRDISEISRVLKQQNEIEK
jgi:hypothetical protein